MIEWQQNKQLKYHPIVRNALNFGLIPYYQITLAWFDL